MSDRYGTIVLTYSDDLKCNFEGLLGSLNQYKWSSDDLLWKKDFYQERTHVFLTDDSSLDTVYLHPTVFAGMEEVVMRNDDGTFRIIKNPTEDEIEEAWRVNIKEVPLKDLTKSISKNLQSGSIEIACVGHNNQNFVYMGRLKISSDGTSRRTYVTCGLDYDYEYSDEYKG